MSRHDSPNLHVTSESFRDGQILPPAQRSGKMRAGGNDESPQLSWSGAPAGTKGYAVTVFDPDAPGRGGFWHWAVLDLPAGATSLPAGAGAEGGRLLPAGALQLKNDGGFHGYLGPRRRPDTVRTATSPPSTPSTWSTWAWKPGSARPSWKPSWPGTCWPAERSPASSSAELAAAPAGRQARAWILGRRHWRANVD